MLQIFLGVFSTGTCKILIFLSRFLDQESAKWPLGTFKYRMTITEGFC